MVLSVQFDQRNLNNVGKHVVCAEENGRIGGELVDRGRVEDNVVYSTGCQWDEAEPGNEHD